MVAVIGFSSPYPTTSASIGTSNAMNKSARRIALVCGAVVEAGGAVGVVAGDSSPRFHSLRIGLRQAQSERN